MEKLVDLCDRYRLPIIADENYAGMVSLVENSLLLQPFQIEFQ